MNEPGALANAPDGVVSYDCAKNKCKAVCDEGMVTSGKRAVKCDTDKEKWKGKFTDCIGCTPLNDPNMKYQEGMSMLIVLDY